ncbi:dynein axonemal heavy chain 8-like [Coccinella septempunctata]|uniref:dynein axonemal heavy chain 8-like n=1 Tax=Coccinella septempunctata TaxID=41139 RepID=UPI001D07D180|nr:dynein axonemal heavy chain 8-like [Coccinella septempunctata]
MLTMTGSGVAVFKCSDVTISIKNVGEVVHYVQLDAPNYSGNIVAMHHDLMRRILSTPLSNNTSKEWGELAKAQSGRKKQALFERYYNQFVNFIGKTKSDVDSVIIFDEEEKIHAILSENSEDSNRLNKELIQRVECAVRIWNKKIERALVQYQQLRKEDEFVGPLEEVEYWRNQLARFSSIVHFISTDTCNILINFLKSTGSGILKSWKKHCNLVYDVRNQCTDNVRYLYAFESFCEPLYRCDPLEIPSHIPSLLYAVRMIFTTSRYFNKMSNVTAILTKISNQLIIVCRSYLNCKGKKTVWNQPKQIVLTKIRHCLDLYLKYYQCFTHIQEEMKEAQENSFGCSEMYVFGKLEAFKKRIEEVTDVLSTTSTYSILESSVIEGIDEFAIKFKEFFKTISSKKYDVLNHRLPDFDKDYIEYKQNVADTEWLLEEFVGICLSKMQDVDNVLRLLKRFEKLNLPCLHLEERYLEAMIMFQDELGNLRDIYNEDRQAPFLPKNMPPVAGRCMWIRHFYRRIERPMLVFKEKTRVIKHRKVQKCIQLFNALSMVFVHYEKLYHEAWYDHCGQVRTCLNVPILVRHPTTRRYLVNFHPYIVEVIRETEFMYKLKLPVPDVGQILVFCRDKMLHSLQVTKQLVERNDTIRSYIPCLFIPLMRTLLIKLENAFEPAFSTLTWTSLSIPEFCEEVNTILEYFEIFVKEVKDLMEARIDEILNQIANTSLLYLPTEPLMPKDFLQANIEYRRLIVVEIENKSLAIENAVVELINKFLSQIDQPDLQENKFNWLDPERALKPISSTSKFVEESNAGFKEIDRQVKLTLDMVHNDCIELFAYFNMKLYETLVKCTKSSLEQLKKEIR